jgi:hypothetical protein
MSWVTEVPDETAHVGSDEDLLNVPKKLEHW